MKRRTQVFLIVLLGIVIILGLWQFWLMFKDWKHTQEQLTSLQIQYYRTAQELADSLNQANFLSRKITALESNNTQLTKEKQKLEEKIVNLQKQKQVIEAKLHSIKELKQAIRQVKIEIHDQKVQQLLFKKAQQKELDAEVLAMGNRGFIIKGAKSTYKPTIRIEVRPIN